jgi:gliding motility-associated-like protein
VKKLNEKMKKYIYIIILIICSYSAHSQQTTQGTDFWLSFGSNAGSPYYELTLQVRVVSIDSTKVQFTFTETGYTETISLSKNSVYTRNLSTTEKQAVYSSETGISKKSLHIQSEKKISVYVINLLPYTTDATGIIPTVSLNLSYFHLSYNPLAEKYDEYGVDDGYTVTAVENNTELYDNYTLVARLNKGDVYSNYFKIDGTGRHITANKPVAYFTTNQCVYIGLPACDCLFQQLFPESLWGVSFMVPVTVRGKERVRILASQNGTIIRHSGGIVISGDLNLDKGEFLELEIDKSEAGCFIESNKPIAVASYLMGLMNELDDSGDPAMTWIPSIEQFINEIIVAPFIAAGTSVIDKHHILIITPANQKDLTKIKIGNGDYQPLSNGFWSDHPSGYSFYTMPLTDEFSSYSLINPKGLAVLGYGLGDFESYYYLAGSALRNLNLSFYADDIHYQDLAERVFCNNEDVDFRAVVNYDMHPEKGHLRWFIDDVEDVELTDVLEWNRIFSGGTHNISMIVKNEYGATDTINSPLVIIDLLEISPAELPMSKLNVDYLQQLTSNAENPVFTLISGNLPSNLTLSGSGELSGWVVSNNLLFHFTIQVEDINGCTGQKSYLLERDIALPKAFTPDGNGINDIFMRGYSVIIFDRLGVEIFRGDNGWDGTYKNKPAPADIYFYILTREAINGVKKYSGYVGIQRIK